VFSCGSSIIMGKMGFSCFFSNIYESVFFETASNERKSIVHLLWLRGRRERGTVLSPCSYSRMQEALSILHLSSGTGRTLHLVRPGETPAAKGAAWLRPCFSSRTLRASKHPSNVARRQDSAPLPAGFLRRYNSYFIRNILNQIYGRVSKQTLHH